MHFFFKKNEYFHKFFNKYINLESFFLKKRKSSVNFTPKKEKNKFRSY